MRHWRKFEKPLHFPCENQEVRNRIAALIVASALLLGAAGLPRKAGDFAIQTGPDKYTWLNQYQGKTLLVAFILTYCQHCQKTTGILNAIQKDYAAKGVQVLGSAIEDMASLHLGDFDKQFHPAFPVGYDDRRYLMKFLGLPVDDNLMMPTLVFIDKNGMIRTIVQGDDPVFTGDQDKNLRQILDKTIADGARK